MEKKDATQPLVEKHQVEGHSVEIRKQEGREELWIDAVRRRFFVTDDGYNLNDDAYAPPHKTLYAAAKAYLQKISRNK